MLAQPVQCALPFLTRYVTLSLQLPCPSVLLLHPLSESLRFFMTDGPTHRACYTLMCFTTFGYGQHWLGLLLCGPFCPSWHVCCPLSVDLDCTFVSCLFGGLFPNVFMALAAHQYHFEVTNTFVCELYVFHVCAVIR